MHLKHIKYNPNGGPDGGDGGKGGSIILRGNHNYWTLLHLDSLGFLQRIYWAASTSVVFISTVDTF